MSEATWKSIDVGEHHLSFVADGEVHTYPKIPLPETFTSWVIEGRRAMYNLLEGKASAPFFGSHLPVVITQSRGERFPFNTGNKGLGLMPVAHKIDYYSGLYRDTFDQCAKDDWEQSLPRRLGAVREFIDSEDVSDEALISLEIFEKTTFANLCDFPIATLHYTGEGPVYKSFQINTVVQIAPPEHPAYQFAYFSRQLFEFDSFHITQTQFPYAYVFHPVEVRDKTPFPKPAPSGLDAPPKEWSDMVLVWDDAVLQQLRHAPTFVQKFIIKITEERARKQGHTGVNLELFEAVRTQYMNNKAAKKESMKNRIKGRDATEHGAMKYSAARDDN